MSVVRGGRGAGLAVLLGPGPTSSPEVTWAHDPDGVVAAVDRMRAVAAPEVPDEAHEALARLQHAMGAKRCQLLTQAIDGLLQKAAAADVIELSGSIWRLRCADDPTHPRAGVYGAQDRARTCAVCGAHLRPDVWLPGDPARPMAEAHAAVAGARVLLVIDADPTHPSVAPLLATARQSRTRLWEVHQRPSPNLYDKTLAQAGRRGLPRLVRRWLGEDAA